MWYRGSLTVPAGTQEADPAVVEVEVCKGRITKFYRLFPSGCAGMVSMQVFYHTRQVYPTTPGQAYIGDRSEVLGDSTVKIDESPYVLELRGWAPDTTFDHTVYVEFYVSESALVLPAEIEQIDLEGVLSGSD